MSSYQPAHAAEPAKKDANNRAARTLVQGLITAVLVGGGLALAAAVTNMTPQDMLDSSVWISAGTLVLHAGLTAGASWLQRRLESRNK